MKIIRFITFPALFFFLLISCQLSQSKCGDEIISKCISFPVYEYETEMMDNEITCSELEKERGVKIGAYSALLYNKKFTYKSAGIREKVSECKKTGPNSTECRSYEPESIDLKKVEKPENFPDSFKITEISNCRDYHSEISGETNTIGLVFSTDKDIFEQMELKVSFEDKKNPAVEGEFYMNLLEGDEDIKPVMKEKNIIFSYTAEKTLDKEHFNKDLYEIIYSPE